MPEKQIALLVLNQMRDNQKHDITDVVQRTLEGARSRGNVYSGDIRSAVLGLIRGHKIELTSDFKVRRLRK
jgi:hypothetical protein